MNHAGVEVSVHQLKSQLIQLALELWVKSSVLVLGSVIKLRSQLEAVIAVNGALRQSVPKLLEQQVCFLYFGCKLNTFKLFFQLDN